MNTSTRLILLFAIIGCAYAGCSDPKTVTEVDLPKLGTIEKDQVCITANYTQFSNGSIGVYNAGRVGTVDGPKKDISGYATIPNKEEPGKLMVHLNGVPYPGNYWILNLGPVVNNQYSWSIVSDNKCADLFVLSRTQTVTNATLTDIQTFLTGVGFDLKKEYVPITQGAECNYSYSDDE